MDSRHVTSSKVQPPGPTGTQTDHLACRMVYLAIIADLETPAKLVGSETCQGPVCDLSGRTTVDVFSFVNRGIMLYGKRAFEVGASFESLLAKASRFIQALDWSPTASGDACSRA